MSNQRLITRSLVLITAFGLIAGVSSGHAPADRSESAGQDPKPEVEVLYGSGIWRKGKHRIVGTYRIERRERDDETEVSLLLSKDFATKEGPDLKVVLSPVAVDRVKAKTALEGALVVGLLQSNRGPSRYVLPRGTDLRKYRSVLIHCERYTVLWGGAALRPGEIVAGGSRWTKKTKAIEGRWEIAKLGDGHVIRLGGNFKTKKAPDLKLVLSPLSVEQAQNDNAPTGGLIVAPLRSHKGAQEFAVPAGTDLSRYRSLLIHCEKYAKLWGGATLGGA